MLLAHLLTMIATLLGPGGAKAIVADSLLMKQQLLIINRSRRRAPNLTPIDRMLLGLWTLFLRPHHIQRAAVILRPSTLLNLHNMLKKRKYRLLYSSSRKRKPGPTSVPLPRERFWDIQVAKIDSLTRQPIVPRPPCVRAASPRHCSAWRRLRSTPTNNGMVRPAS